MIKDFVTNPVIRELAPKPFWTVNIEGKKPLDIKEYKRTGRIWGTDGTTDLKDLILTLKAVPQYFVYKLDAKRDGYVILDIEKKCPDDIKQSLLKLPFLYGDISMSGMGYHLVFPCPPLDEMTVNKVAMKEENGYYEILICHNVTFTANTITPKYNANNAPFQFQQIWDDLYKTQKLFIKKELDIDFDNIDLSFLDYDRLEYYTLKYFRSHFHKDLADYGNDMSRYEFAIITSLRASLNCVLPYNLFSKERFNKPTPLDDNQKIAVIYKLAKKVLDYRPKHDSDRGGIPFLLYEICNNFAIGGVYEDSDIAKEEAMAKNNDNNEGDDIIT